MEDMKSLLPDYGWYGVGRKDVKQGRVYSGFLPENTPGFHTQI